MKALDFDAKKEIPIVPRIGVGPLKFGMSIEEVKSCFDDGSGFLEETPEHDINLRYEKQGLNFLFESEEDLKLTSIEFFKMHNFTLYGVSLLGNSGIRELLSYFSQKNVFYNEEDVEDPLSDATLEKSISVPDLSMEIYLDEREYVTALSIGVVIDEKDNVQWPED